MQLLYMSIVIISILLVLVILLQNKNVTLNLSTMSGSSGPTTKRGPEKILHNATILFGVLFILNAVLLFIFA